MALISETLKQLKKGDIPQNTEDLEIYNESLVEYENIKLIMVKYRFKKYLLAEGSGSLLDELTGDKVQNLGKICPLIHENRVILNEYFEFTKPVAFNKNSTTIGLGDRLGLATPGHIKAIQGKNIKPVFAQQSIRELTMTKREMIDVLDAACFAVFQEGYKGGFGADADHLKEEEDIQSSLSIGMSMITLDCSDKIEDTTNMNYSEVSNKFESLPDDLKNYYLREYNERKYHIKKSDYYFSKKDLLFNVITYGRAIDFTEKIYNKYMKEKKQEVDFELSIDETISPTSLLSHFFIANELSERGVKLTSLAPKFCGEFQKGIDYIGDIHEFEENIKGHALIADNFDYKLSIHSGSDKFSVFPLIAKYTHGIFHVKTAGTNWLEAIRVIANVNPDLYREIHEHALKHIKYVQGYYNINPELSDIPQLKDVADNELSDYLDNNVARQLLHVTYGLLLTDTDSNRDYIFREKILYTLDRYENLYHQYLIKHIGEHLSKLNVKDKEGK